MSNPIFFRNVQIFKTSTMPSEIYKTVISSNKRISNHIKNFENSRFDLLKDSDFPLYVSWHCFVSGISTKQNNAVTNWLVQHGAVYPSHVLIDCCPSY